jgi:spermidine synthase
VCSFLTRFYLSIFELTPLKNERSKLAVYVNPMNTLPLLSKVRSVQEFHESDKEQGVERTYLYYKGSSIHLYTEKQEVDLVESPSWGMMLFLDGVLQSTTRDEVIYHNALVHPLMANLRSMKSILILGGGEGATAREVLRWPVESVTMVDYDKELVEHMKLHGKSWSQGAFEDPRLTILYKDAWVYLQSDLQFDGVIIDLTDPEPKVQRWRNLLRMVMKSIKESKGGFVVNAGLYVPWKTETLYVIKNMIHTLCSQIAEYAYKVYTSFVPSFNGEWTFIVVYNKEVGILNLDSLSMIPAWIHRGIHTLDNELIDTKIYTEPSTSKITRIDI